MSRGRDARQTRTAGPRLHRGILRGENPGEATTRNPVLTLTAALVFTAIAGLDRTASAEAAPAPRPNVVVLMADDLDNSSLEALMDLGMMPNLERYLIAEGITFTNEESIRVPLYVRAPGTMGGAVREQLVVNNDLAPTIAELAEAVPDLVVDGTSFVPLLDDGAATEPWRRRFLVEHWDGASARVMDVPTYAGVRAKGDSPFGPVDVLYVEYENADPTLPPDSPELYDLARDPYQLRSLHADGAPLRVLQRQILAGFLAELAACGGGSCELLEF